MSQIEFTYRLRLYVLPVPLLPFHASILLGEKTPLNDLNTLMLNRLLEADKSDLMRLIIRSLQPPTNAWARISYFASYIALPQVTYLSYLAGDSLLIKIHVAPKRVPNCTQWSRRRVTIPRLWFGRPRYFHCTTATFLNFLNFL